LMCGPAQPMVRPGRTLFVARPPKPRQSCCPGVTQLCWPGADTEVFFTTIADALAQAETMTPEDGNPVAVIIFPGTYAENIEILSWVFLSSASTHQNAVTIKGKVTWKPTGTGFEVVQLYFLDIRDTTTVDTTGKTGGQTTFILHGCGFVDGLEV